MIPKKLNKMIGKNGGNVMLCRKIIWDRIIYKMSNFGH